MHATKAAVEEGIVPGGGVALLRAHLRGRGKIEARRRRSHRASAIVLTGARRADLRQIVATTRAKRVPSSSVNVMAARSSRWDTTPRRWSHGRHAGRRYHRSRQGHARRRCSNAASIAGLHDHHRGPGLRGSGADKARLHAGMPGGMPEWRHGRYGRLLADCRFTEGGPGAQAPGPFSLPGDRARSARISLPAQRPLATMILWAGDHPAAPSSACLLPYPVSVRSPDP